LVTKPVASYGLYRQAGAEMEILLACLDGLSVCPLYGLPRGNFKMQGFSGAFF
jgi:hypothetical protein